MSDNNKAPGKCSPAQFFEITAGVSEFTHRRIEGLYLEWNRKGDVVVKRIEKQHARLARASRKT